MHGKIRLNYSFEILIIITFPQCKVHCLFGERGYGFFPSFTRLIMFLILSPSTLTIFPFALSPLT